MVQDIHMDAQEHLLSAVTTSDSALLKSEASRGVHEVK